MKSVMAAARQEIGRSSTTTKSTIAGQVLDLADYTMRLIATEGLAVQTLSDRDGAVALDTNVTPELEREGLARDIVRLIQMTRKEADLNIADHIALTIAGPDAVRDAVDAHRGFIGEQTLSDEITFGDAPDGAFTAEHSVDNHLVAIAVRKIG